MQEVHARLQPFLLFFIDGASYIDEDDPKWELLLVLEQQEGQHAVVRLLLATLTVICNPALKACTAAADID